MKKPKGRQYRLSTLIVITLIAGTLLALNLTPREITMQEFGPAVLVPDFVTGGYTDVFQHTFVLHGWPLEASSQRRKTMGKREWDGNRPATDLAPVGPGDVEIDWKSVVVDVLCAGAILGLVAFFAEYATRDKTPNRGKLTSRPFRHSRTSRVPRTSS